MLLLYFFLSNRIYQQTKIETIDIEWYFGELQKLQTECKFQLLIKYQ